MNRFKTILTALWIGILMLLWIPTVVNAQIFSVKRNPLDAMASFGITAGYAGLLAYDPIPFEPDQYTTAFGGTYLSHGPDGSGTAYAWMVDPRQAGSVTSQVKVRYITVNGVTTYSGLFKSHGPESTPGKTPDGPTDVGGGPVNGNPVNPIISGVLPVNPSPALPVVQGVTPPPPDPSLVVPSTGSNLNSSISAGVNTSSAGSTSVSSSSSSSSSSSLGSSGSSTTSVSNSVISVTLTGGSGTGGTITGGGGSSGGGSGHVVNPPAVPEPGEYAMMLIGAAMVGFRVRQKQGKAR